ncbi:MAG: PAS domain-containing protein, partial [Gammaproteobacteria bacterium]|nr:PAS domain-containing protein [Gammaproteobacteria bacterium]
AASQAKSARLLHRLPLLLALGFVGYSLGLLGYSAYSWQQMKRDIDRYLLADSARQASALADLGDLLREKAKSLANLSEVSSYLINRDLGMSMRYGLGASLQAIEQRFKQQLQRDPSGQTLRILYLDETGKPLADTHPGSPLPRLPHLGSDTERVAIHIDQPQAQLICRAWVIHKNAKAGSLVSVSSARLLYRNLISDPAKQQRELLLTQEGEELLGSDANPLPPKLRHISHLSPPGQVQETRLLSNDGSLLIRTPIRDLPLELINLLPKAQAYAGIPKTHSLLLAGLMPLLLVAAALYLERLRAGAERLQNEVLLAEQKQQSAEERNRELAAEIYRRTLLERALSASEERWQLAVEGTNDGIWDWDLQSGKLFFSERWVSMLGYPRNHFEGKVSEWQDLLHPEDEDRVLEILQDHLQGKTQFFQAEFRLRCADGSYTWILGRGKARFNDWGVAVRMAGSHTDISQRRAAEERIQDRNEQLDAIFALSPDGFVSFDSNFCVKYASPAFLRLTDLELTEIIGLNETDFSARLIAACIDQARFPGMEVLRQAARSQNRKGAEVKRHLIEMASAGSKVLQVGLRESGAGSVSQILYFRDVTHETEVDRMKSEFLSTATHELRTPMASIYGFTELLMSREFDAASQKEFLGTIFRQAELMITIINELLDLARIEARRGKDFVLEPLDPCVLCREAADGFKPPDNRPAPLIGEMACDKPIRGDRNKLAQALGNVLSNAYKYSPEGGPVRIDFVAPEAEGALAGMIGIRISDQGIGMQPNQLERVCERFYRADTSGKIPGTGLGMSVVKEIVQLHGGDLSIDSQVGKGTSVSLWLPVVKSE